jgi:hypothetical protein
VIKEKVKKIESEQWTNQPSNQWSHFQESKGVVDD